MHYITVFSFAALFGSTVATLQYPSSCEQACEDKYAPEWSACNGDKDCQSAVESKALDCIRDCQ